jgi:hypothetical protein
VKGEGGGGEGAVHVLDDAREMDARREVGNGRRGRKGEHKCGRQLYGRQESSRLRRARLNQSRAC